MQKVLDQAKSDAETRALQRMASQRTDVIGCLNAVDDHANRTSSDRPQEALPLHPYNRRQSLWTAEERTRLQAALSAVGRQKQIVRLQAVISAVGLLKSKRESQDVFQTETEHAPTRPLPLDGLGWTDRERERVQAALVALRALRAAPVQLIAGLPLAHEEPEPSWTTVGCDDAERRSSLSGHDMVPNVQLGQSLGPANGISETADTPAVEVAAPVSIQAPDGHNDPVTVPQLGIDPEPRAWDIPPRPEQDDTDVVAVTIIEGNEADRSPELLNEHGDPRNAPVATEVAERHFVLDWARLERIREDDAAASVLLAGLFVEDVDDQLPLNVTAVSPFAVLASQNHIRLGLDEAHFTLLTELICQPNWSRGCIQRRVDELGLMFDGALEHLNEAVFDLAGEALIVDDGDLDVNQTVAGEVRKALVLA
jgi:hypothetical protein